MTDTNQTPPAEKAPGEAANELPRIIFGEAKLVDLEQMGLSSVGISGITSASIAVAIPAGAAIFRVRMLNDIRIYFRHHENAPRVPREFIFRRTGDEVPGPNYRYIESFDAGYEDKGTITSVHLFERRGL